MALADVDRRTHGTRLKRALLDVVPILEERQREIAARQIDTSPGIILEFESFPELELALPRLDSARGDIQLLNVREAGGKMYATCFVPEGRLNRLVAKFDDYLNNETKKSKEPKNKELAQSIQSIGVATFAALWTDDAPIPADNDHLWWEIWLRTDNLVPAAAYNRFQLAADRFEIHLATQRLDFPERVVVNARATKAQLSRSFIILNMIAEIRRADEPLVVPEHMTILEQDAIIETLEDQIRGDSDVAVSVLDTGVLRGHPLLEPALAADDMHAVNPDWGTSDHHGHGTKMAGLALYGCLHAAAAQAGAAPIEHRLESVKILAPANPDPETDHDVLGKVVAQAVSRCEIAAPQRRRVICKAITTSSHDSGEPSAYSAAIDQLSFGHSAVDGRVPGSRRLFAISAGNVQPDERWLTYPQSNQNYQVEQPAQAWNALTIGAFTDKVLLPAIPDYAGWQAMADRGDLSPFSSTSVGWSREWPIKPEVLFEGGNLAVDPTRTETAQPNTLQMLTTSRVGANRPTVTFNMTSAATALASRLAAQIMTTYPDAWPETVRGLIVHHANWTQAQLDRYLTDQSQATKLRMLRTCGYGVVSPEKALHSARDGVTILVQSTLQPFKIEEYRGKMNKLRLFELPWPKNTLLALGALQVRLKVTLSYFVEPSPGKRGWEKKYRYASHGFRFALRRLNESPQEFNQRVNHALLAEEEDVPGAQQDAGWTLGPKLQTFGSVHSDTWTGTAADLATRNLLAVYPVIGWWRERMKLKRVTTNTRFALILSLEAPGAELDLYQLLGNQIQLEPIDLEALMEGNLELGNEE
ncbi:S8 family peptidase [Herbaspirillum huttiense]|uniref:S8 family peptidase n=1 Tax=Herbaspirillum huttiense subsp. lycopersici TaxID=3074428 RepID=A0ABU2ET76_9BURK|nr:S8 family peptidase [Herbaspirillum huttiense]MDR9851380.1 S8 family peptidase [Herbaspirillum huttiense SE1]